MVLTSPERIVDWPQKIVHHFDNSVTTEIRNSNLGTLMELVRPQLSVGDDVRVHIGQEVLRGWLVTVDPESGSVVLASRTSEVPPRLGRIRVIMGESVSTLERASLARWNDLGDELVRSGVDGGSELWQETKGLPLGNKAEPVPTVAISVETLHDRYGVSHDITRLMRLRDHFERSHITCRFEEQEGEPVLNVLERGLIRSPFRSRDCISTNSAFLVRLRSTVEDFDRTGGCPF